MSVFPSKRTMDMSVNSVTMPIFVFGSNLAGRHGKGSAKHAYNKCGAQWGVGFGRTGNAYAIPTKDKNIRTMPIVDIVPYIDEFIKYANDNPDLTFELVRIGCGLAGYTDQQIAPLFAASPDNVLFPKEWKNL